MNAARPAPGALLVRLDDVPDGGAVVRSFASGAAQFSVIIARKGSDAFAYENRCTHAAFPLERADGRVLVQEQRFLVCDVHGASYDMRNGACAGGPCTGALTPVAIEIVEGVVLIR